MRCTSSGVLMLAAVVALAACAEKPQTASARKSDVPAFQGTGGTPFAAAGWKAGDEASWEQQTRSRAQNGQNEYSRTSAP